MYEFLHKLSYAEGNEGYKKYLRGESNKEKIGSMKGILSVLFETKSIKNGDFVNIEIL